MNTTASILTLGLTSLLTTCALAKDFKTTATDVGASNKAINVEIECFYEKSHTYEKNGKLFSEGQYDDKLTKTISIPVVSKVNGEKSGTYDSELVPGQIFEITKAGNGVVLETSPTIENDQLMMSIHFEPWKIKVGKDEVVAVNPGSALSVEDLHVRLGSYAFGGKCSYPISKGERRTIAEENGFSMFHRLSVAKGVTEKETLGKVWKYKYACWVNKVSIDDTECVATQLVTKITEEAVLE